MRQKLRDEVAFLVVATPVEDKAQSPDVAQRLAAGRLASMLPKEVPIRVVTEAPESKVGVRLDLALERVLPLKAVEPFQKTQRYLAGNRSVPNPRAPAVRGSAAAGRAHSGGGGAQAGRGAARLPAPVRRS